MDYLIYGTYVLVLAALLWGAKVAGRHCWNETFMSLDQTKMIQGFCAVCIMLHHAGQKTCAPWHDSKVIVHGLDFFVPIGYFLVAVFLFCSGYGLYKSYKGKADYFKGFFKRRVLPIVVVFYATAWIFLLVRFFMGEQMNGAKIFYYISGLQLSNPNAWYAIALPIFYGIFYLAFRFCKKDGWAIFLTCFGVFLYTLLGTFIDHNDWWFRGEWWYNSVHMFSVGILFARFEKPVLAVLKKYYPLWLGLALVGTVGFFYFSEWTTGVFSYYGENWGAPDKVMRRWVCLAAQMAASFMFVASVFLLNLKIKLGNPFLRLMGTVTLEFYMIHGLFIELFGYSFLDMRPSIYYIKNAALFLLVVVVLSVPATWILKKMTNLLRKG